MRIIIHGFSDGDRHSGRSVLDVGPRECTLTGVYNGIGIETDEGLFGIAQRDSGIEVMLDGELVWSSTARKEQP